jgi:hypothetical protein
LLWGEEEEGAEQEKDGGEAEEQTVENGAAEAEDRGHD